MENDHLTIAEKPARRQPWNKGKLVGAKPPLRPSHMWSITSKLQIEGRKRDLALFNLAIDSKLRGCDDPHLTASNPTSVRLSSSHSFMLAHFQLSDSVSRLSDESSGLAEMQSTRR